MNPPAFPTQDIAPSVIRTFLTAGASLGTDAFGDRGALPRYPEVHAYFRRVLSDRGYTDALLLNAIDPTRTGCLFFVPMRDPPKLSGPLALRYQRIAASARAALRAAAVSVDRARGSLRHRDPEGAVAAWRGLVAGRWSLVDRFDRDGRRYLIAHKNDPDTMDPRGLTPRERQVAGFAALGQSDKVIAYELGISPSTVSVLLSRAAQKLGVQSRAELVQMLGAKRP
jgi:DNA-binding CsgD family transcriptional regulator